MASSVTRLKLPKIKENLRPLIAADKEISSLFNAEMLRKIGLQQHLREMYKPITEETKTIASKIEEGTQQSTTIARNIEEGTRQATQAELSRREDDKARAELLKEIQEYPKLGEILMLLKNYPEVIKYIRGAQEYILSEKDIRIIDLIDKLPSDQKTILCDYFAPAVKEEFEASHKLPPAESKLYSDIRKGRTEKRMKEVLEYTTQKDLNELAEEIAILKIKNLKRSAGMPMLEKLRPGFLQKVRDYEEQAAESKVGTGIQFLPSGYKELKNKLVLALGSYKAGNKNTFNEISAIMDELRRQGKISIKDIKGIFKLMKIK